MARTSDYSLKYAAVNCKQTGTVAGDLWDGTNTPTLGAGDQVLFDDLKIGDQAEYAEDNSRNGTQLGNGQELSVIKASIEGKTKIWTDGIAHVLTSVLGWTDLEGPATAAGGLKSHLISFNQTGKDQRAYTTAEQAKITGYAAGDIYNTHMTFGVREANRDVILRHGQLTDFTLSGNAKDPITLEFAGVGHDVVNDTTRSSLSAITVPAGKFSNFYCLRHCVESKLGPVGSQAIYKVTEFSIKGKHGAAVDNQSTVSGVNREYPYADGASELTADITLFTDEHINTIKAWETSQASITVSLKFKRGDNYFHVMIPALKVASATSEFGNAGSIKVSGKLFNYTGADLFQTDHAGQTLDFASPLVIQVIDSDSENGLRKN